MEILEQSPRQACVRAIARNLGPQTTCGRQILPHRQKQALTLAVVVFAGVRRRIRCCSNVALSDTFFPRFSLFLACLGWVLMLAGTAHVYHTFLSSELEGIKNALFPYEMLSNPSLVRTRTELTRSVGQNQTTYITTTTELDDSERSAVCLISYAWSFINEADILVEGYMWWMLAFQLFGIINADLSDRKLAPLCMHVVLTACTFMYTRSVLSGYTYCLQRAIKNEHHPQRVNSTDKAPYEDVADAVLLAVDAAADELDPDGALDLTAILE